MATCHANVNYSALQGTKFRLLIKIEVGAMRFINYQDAIWPDSLSDGLVIGNLSFVCRRSQIDSLSIWVLTKRFYNILLANCIVDIKLDIMLRMNECYL
jgi:hypothetical protein